MDGLLILLIIWWVISKVNKNKSKKAEKKGGTAAPAQRTAPKRQHTDAPARNNPRRPQPVQARETRETAEEAFRVFFEDEGTREGEDMPGHDHSAHTMERHVLRPSMETGHAHTESSMGGGDADCDVFPASEPRMMPERPETHREEPQAHVAVSFIQSDDTETAAKPSAGTLRFDPTHAREAFLAAEILSKPKALRGRSR